MVEQSKRNVAVVSVSADGKNNDIGVISRCPERKLYAYFSRSHKSTSCYFGTAIPSPVSCPSLGFNSPSLAWVPAVTLQAQMAGEQTRLKQA